MPADHVPCPLCDRGFPAAEIELHAMYCNGIVGEDAATDSPGVPCAVSVHLLSVLVAPFAAACSWVLESCSPWGIWV